MLHAGVSFQAASRIISLVSELFGLSWDVPHATTGRLWVLRLGIHKLERPKRQAEDWVWLMDHTNQVGQEKCLAIVGIRLSDLPPPGECLSHEHLEPIDLIPVTKSNKDIVYQQLESNIAKTGVPRAILSDHGGDIKAGTKLFCEAHPGTSSLYDIAHKGASLLKRRLEKDPCWTKFCTEVGQTKCHVQQTAAGFLAPPNQRSKARFMNLGPMLRWARETLSLVDHTPPEVIQHCTKNQFELNCGWLTDYRESLSRWCEYHQLVNRAIDWIRRHGYSLTARDELASRLNPLAVSQEGKQLRDEILEFVENESSQALPHERLPGSTEVLESLFGRFKAMEKQYDKSGFTTLLSAFGALLSETTAEIVGQALESTPTKRIAAWCKTNLGVTFQSKRVGAYQAAKKLAGAQETG